MQVLILYSLKYNYSLENGAKENFLVKRLYKNNDDNCNFRIETMYLRRPQIGAGDAIQIYSKIHKYFDGNQRQGHQASHVWILTNFVIFN